MTTKDYPLDYIQALHLLLGESRVTLEDTDGDRYHRDKGVIQITYFSGHTARTMFSSFMDSRVITNFRIYEPPAPEKLAPVELCEEITDICISNNHRLFGLAIAQAVRMAREEREAEKKGEER